MHGPEHHALIPAAIVAGYLNTISKKENMIKEAVGGEAKFQAVTAVFTAPAEPQ